MKTFCMLMCLGLAVLHCLGAPSDSTGAKNSDDVPAIDLEARAALAAGGLPGPVLIGPRLPKGDALAGQYFEGDLKVPEDMITRNYNPQRTKLRRSVMDDDSRLWPSRTFVFDFHSSMSTSARNIVLQAMGNWSSLTCVSFKLRSSESDYVRFRADDTGCYSDSIGMDGGEQTINLQPPDSDGKTCQTVGIAMHEIGHALGFWHEQSRPDRDSYVTINFNNIISGKEGNFAKRANEEVDYRASGYDYGSIMHYGTTAFGIDDSAGNPKTTITVSNTAAFTAQGSPTLGQRNLPSSSDITQMNRLYYCPSQNFETGSLKVVLNFGSNLPDTDPDFIFSNDPDCYVVVTAVKSNGAKVIKQSSIISSTDPDWNGAVLDFGTASWQFFRIQVRDQDDLDADDDVTMSKTYVITAGTHSHYQACGINGCGGYLDFDYFLDETNECASNPCLNGGTCVNGVAQYTCTCSSGFSGSRCQYVAGTLTIKVKTGTNVGGTNPSYPKDPYVLMKATRADGVVVTKKTATRWATLNPVWNINYNFGTDSYTSFVIQVWDDNSDETVTNSKGIEIPVADSLIAGKTVSLTKGVSSSSTVAGVGFDYSYL